MVTFTVLLRVEWRRKGVLISAVRGCNMRVDAATVVVVKVVVRMMNVGVDVDGKDA